MPKEKDSTLEKAIRDAMLDAEFNFRYWRYMTVRYAKRERFVKIFLAATSSSTVASWGIWHDVDIAWKLLSGLSAVIAVALPILDWPKAIQAMAKLTSQFQQLLVDREELYLDSVTMGKDPEEMRGRLYSLKKREVQIEQDLLVFPYKGRLAAKCQDEVRRRRASLFESKTKEKDDLRVKGESSDE